MAQLIVQSAAPGMPRVIDLKPGVNRFGRAGMNDCLLDDPAISDEHCEIEVGTDIVTVRDLGSTNGTYIDRQRIDRATLGAGQTLQIGQIQMVLEARAIPLAIPTLNPGLNPYVIQVEFLPDGFPACLQHGGRHAVWECTDCHRPYCDECVKKLRRVGGAFLKLCPACSKPCQLTAWAESVKRRKKNFITKIAETISASFKRSTHLIRQIAVPKKRPVKK